MFSHHHIQHYPRSKCLRNCSSGHINHLLYSSSCHLKFTSPARCSVILYPIALPAGSAPVRSLKSIHLICMETHAKALAPSNAGRFSATQCNSFNIKIHGHKIILMAKVLRFLSTQFSIKICIYQNFAFARSWGRRQNSRMIIFLAFHSSRWAATKSKEPVQTILWPLLVRVNAEASSSMTSRFAFIVPEKRKRFGSVALHNHWIN